MSGNFNLKKLQIETATILRNIAPAKFYEEALKYERGIGEFL